MITNDEIDTMLDFDDLLREAMAEGERIGRAEKDADAVVRLREENRKLVSMVCFFADKMTLINGENNA